jgi:hypothetical protein
MDSTTQLDFLFALFRPLISTADAGFLLDDCSERHVLDLVDEGQLLAINIAVDTTGRRELRIHRYSVLHRIARPKRPLGRVPADKIIPHFRPTVLRRELADWMSCSEQHISNLNLAGPRDGHDRRHRIYRHAVVDFLTTREIKP